MSSSNHHAAAIAFCVVAFTIATACAAPATSLPAGVDISSVRARAAAEMAAPLTAFVEHRRQRPTPFDWSSDGCSKSPDQPMGFDFTAACWRHDFGYRNFLHGLGLDPSRDRKVSIDNQLAADLETICRRYTWWRKLCGNVAHVYVWAVRVAGR